MASLDWSKCPAVESVPGKRSDAVVFRGTRTPVSAVFENLQDMTIEELTQEFGVTREQVEAVLQFAARSTEAPTSLVLVLFDNGTPRTHAGSFSDRRTHGYRSPVAGLGGVRERRTIDRGRIRWL